jgi:hypothetical protein
MKGGTYHTRQKTEKQSCRYLLSNPWAIMRHCRANVKSTALPVNVIKTLFLIMNL